MALFWETNLTKFLEEPRCKGGWRSGESHLPPTNVARVQNWAPTLGLSLSTVFVRLHVNYKPAFSKISSLETVFENMGF